jgi:hypothetical protein
MQARPPPKVPLKSPPWTRGDFRGVINSLSPEGDEGSLLVLASLILIIELCRAGGLYPRIVLLSVLTLFCLTIQRRASPNPSSCIF